MSKTIGLIMEDKSDIEVIDQVLMKYMKINEYSIKKFIGNGCGKLKNKCDSWTNNLFKRGCDHVIIFHDLDRNDEVKLRNELTNKVSPESYPNSLIVIPVEEIEAWLLSDTEAIKKVFKLKKKPKRITNCEKVNSPKEFIQKIVWQCDRKRYVNTIHNKRIAAEVSIKNLERCESFRPFHKYIVENICT